MKSNTTRRIVVAALFVFSSAAFAQEAEPPVAVKTDGLPPQLKERIEQKAQQGQSALIRYLNNTRHIHQLRVEDVVRREQPQAVAKPKAPEATKVAEQGEAAR
jgi:hypothetical protein